MGRTIVVEPITRIEGHAKVTIHLDEQGRVHDAIFHVTEFRGFEKFCEGRPFWEMPSLTARICGICPVSHLIASAKACDALMAVEIPETAVKLRHIMHLAQIVESHALSFFHLSAPDLLLGMDADPADRNLFGLIRQHPEIAREGIRLRRIGQEIIEILGGRRIHPAWVVPGGVSQPLSAEKRDRILAMLPEALTIVRGTLAWFKRSMDRYRDEVRTFANFPSLFMGLVTPDGELEHYDGKLRIVDGTGRIIADGLEPARYADIIGEAVEPYSYLKFPYYKPMGYPEGIYRVGPLARLNIVSRCGTPLADQEWAEFRQMERGLPLSSFYYHYARLIEVVYALERMQRLLDSPDILDTHVRAHAGPNRREGVGVAEAPRGTLFHHYRINDDGQVVWVNLIIATAQNNLAMNRGVLQVAQQFVDGNRLTEGMLNRVEAVIRAFDPCLSCSTHALGQMPLRVLLVAADGTVLDEVRRG